MEKSKINSLQLATILVFIISAPLTGVNMTYLFDAAGVDAYICPIIASILGIPLIFMFIFMFNYKPDLTLGEKIIYTFGKKLGIIINILLICFAFFFTITLFFNLTDFIVSQFLPETPNKMIAFFFSIAIIYVSIKGLETISRTSLVLLFFTFLIFIISILGLSSSFEISNIKPFFEFGINHTLKGIIHIFSVNYFPIFLLLTVPKNQITDKEKFSKYLILAYIIATLIMFLIILLTLGNLGINLATTYQYPEYIVLKRINLFDFLDRIENILSMQRIMKIFMFITFFVYFISNTVKAHNNSKIIPIITVIIIFLISHNIFTSNTQFNNFLLNYISLFRFLFLSLIIFILIGFIIKKQKK